MWALQFESAVAPCPRPARKRVARCRNSATSCPPDRPPGISCHLSRSGSRIVTERLPDPGCLTRPGWCNPLRQKTKDWAAYRMKRYLVTGGAGFIGSHLVHHLTALGHQVRVLDDLSTGRTDNLARETDLIV